MWDSDWEEAGSVDSWKGSAEHGRNLENPIHLEWCGQGSRRGLDHIRGHGKPLAGLTGRSEIPQAMGQGRWDSSVGWWTERQMDLHIPGHEPDRAGLKSPIPHLDVLRDQTGDAHHRRQLFT